MHKHGTAGHRTVVRHPTFLPAPTGTVLPPCSRTLVPALSPSRSPGWPRPRGLFRRSCPAGRRARGPGQEFGLAWAASGGSGDRAASECGECFCSWSRLGEGSAALLIPALLLKRRGRAGVRGGEALGCARGCARGRMQGGERVQGWGVRGRGWVQKRACVCR